MTLYHSKRGRWSAVGKLGGGGGGGGENEILYLISLKIKTHGLHKYSVNFKF